MDVRRALQHGGSHQSIDEPDNGCFARHVLQALDVVVTNEDLLAGLLARHARLARLFGWLVESLQCAREILLRDEAGSDWLLEFVGNRGERLGIEGVRRRNDEGICRKLDRQQTVAAQEVRRERGFDVLEHGRGRQLRLAENGIAEIFRNRGQKLRRWHETKFRDDYVDSLPGL